MHYHSISEQILVKSLDVVSGFRESSMPRTVRTAEESPSAFDSVPDYLALTVFADRREFMDRAFKAVKDVPLTSCDHFETEFVVVLANFALGHVYETRWQNELSAITVTKICLAPRQQNEPKRRHKHLPCDTRGPCPLVLPLSPDSITPK